MKQKKIILLSLIAGVLCSCSNSKSSGEKDLRPDIVKENIVLLEKYGIDYKKCMNLSFLGESILAKLSLFIEDGKVIMNLRELEKKRPYLDLFLMT